MDPSAAIGGALCVLVVMVPVALWIGSFILRAAIGLTNKVMGGAAPSDLDFYDDPMDYRYGRPSQASARSGLAIPVPSTGRAMGILLFIGVVDFVVRMGIMMAAGFGAAFAPQGGDGAMAALIAIPVSFVVHLAMLSSLLPTTIGRAFLVLVFQFLIVLMICVLIGAAIAAIVIGRGGMR